MYEHFCHEGGSCTPMIAHWPRGIEDVDRWVREPVHIMDIMPTLCALALASAAHSLLAFSDRNICGLQFAASNGRCMCMHGPSTPLRLEAHVAGAMRSEVELVFDADHHNRVVREGMLRATTSLDIATADFKAMLVPTAKGRRAKSIVEVFRCLADKGVEIRLLHSGVPSGAALQELRRQLPSGIVIRRCPRLHAKAVIVDCRAMYLGSANLTGAGLGAKGPGKRNFEIGIWTHASTLIDAVLEHFNALWEGRLCSSCRRQAVCPVPLEEPHLS
jgi:hypothetical protein